MCSTPDIPPPPPPPQEAKQADSMAQRRQRRKPGQLGGSLLTSPSGVDLRAQNLGGSTLLGG